QKVYDDFSKALDDVEARIAAGGAKLNSVFEDLKQMQRRYRDAKMSNEHRNKLWERLDGAFKAAKERKFGKEANEGSVTERHERRLSGLDEAIKRMEDSIRRDEEELAFQRKKVNTTEGQLEAQIRMAKIKMVEERLSSKHEKLAEMTRTRADVEKQSNVAKEKENKRAEKEAEKQRIEKAKEQVKSEIAAGIRSKNNRNEEQNQDSLFEAATTVIGDVLLDALDTAKAVAVVASEKAGEMLENVIEKMEDVAEALQTKKEETAPETTPANPEPEPETAPVAEAPTPEPLTETTAEVGTEPAAEEPATSETNEAVAATHEPAAQAAETDQDSKGDA
ncbi:MAG: hypothetical protein KGS48_13205, partial [Bacteroidetes bacterium]|nr:hypothetical protein [Bacteroidota bacterium]